MILNFFYLQHPTEDLFFCISNMIKIKFFPLHIHSFIYSTRRLFEKKKRGEEKKK